MATPWTAAPPELRGGIRAAHDLVVGERLPAPGIRPVVAQSWQRSLDLSLDPDGLLAGLDMTEDDLRAYRDGHRLAIVLPVIQRLLVRHTVDAGLIVAVGDASGRLLWVDGDRRLRRLAEGMRFIEGADWSERRVGTTAPGTALTLDHGVQITGAEHFSRVVHPWSCTAVPVHEADGELLGVIDITGGDDAAAPATLPLLEAAAAAVEAELRLHDATRRRIRPPRRAPSPLPLLHVLGRDGGVLEHEGRRSTFSLRHAELVVLLAAHPDGLTAERLAQLVYGRDDATVTLRAEMVRLRRALPAALAPLSRPYRLPTRIDVDLRRVMAFLDRGAHRVALGAYPGPLLPASDAPGIAELRTETAVLLRDALLEDAAVDVLLDFAARPENADDAELLQACLRLLPPRSPRRAHVVGRLERIEWELAATRAQPPRT